MRIVVAGTLAGTPRQGGASWAVLQYVLGLERLGHDVTLIEQVGELSPEIESYFSDVAADFGLEGRAGIVGGERRTAGLGYRELQQKAQAADILLNLSGILRDPELRDPPPVRVFLDLDPCFNQVWHEQGIDVGLDGHTHHVTVGLALGSPGCAVPLCGRTWLTTTQPVVLDRWPRANGVVHDALTTVGNWRSYGPVEHEGATYGQKAHSLRQLLELPRLSADRFLLALAVHPGETSDLEAMRAHDWELVDPADVAGTPALYQRFVSGSRAEFGLAKSGYVDSRSGWFSDRSACYLASGRPVLAQDTGFGRYLPAGKGLLAFGDVEEAAAAVAEVRRDYAAHSDAAYELAREHFDSDRVLSRLLACL
jgi:hypothetical protein